MKDQANRDVTMLERVLPSQHVLLEAAGDAKLLLETLFIRLESARRCVDDKMHDAYVDAVLNVFEWSVSVVSMTFTNHVVQHRTIIEQVHRLHEEKGLGGLCLDGVLVASFMAQLGLNSAEGDWKLVVNAACEIYRNNLITHINDEAFLHKEFGDATTIQQAMDDLQDVMDSQDELSVQLFHKLEQLKPANVSLSSQINTPASAQDILTRCGRLCVLGSNASDISAVFDTLVDEGSTFDNGDVEEGFMNFRESAGSMRQHHVVCVNFDEKLPCSRFISQRTIFVVSVDFEGYLKSIGESDNAALNFVRDNILSWTERVRRHQPDATFVVVAAHATQLASTDIQIIMEHLKLHAHELSSSPVVVSSSNSGLSIDARQELQDIIIQSDAWVEMEVSCCRVLHEIHRIRRRAATKGLGDRAMNVIVPGSFQTALTGHAALRILHGRVRKINGLTDASSQSSLDILSDLGEIIYTRNGEREGSRSIVLDPSVVNSDVLCTLLFPHENDELPLDEEGIYSIVKLLCSLGVVWGKSTTDRWNEILHEVEEDPDFVSDRAVFQSGLGACVQLWVSQLAENPQAQLTDVPVSNIMSGATSVMTFVRELQDTQVEEVLYRRKICVVGHSFGGKTSLIKSIVSGRPCLQTVEERTIGVEIQRHSFTTQHSRVGKHVVRKYDINCWDFAGQDVYSAAHVLFFSKRALYVICLCLEDYVNELKPKSGESYFQTNARVDRFVRDRVFRRARLILSHQPESELVVVCTKSDTVDAMKTQTVIADFAVRLEDWTDQYLMELGQSNHVNKIKDSLRFLRNADVIPLSVRTQQGVDNARDVIQKLVLARPQLSFQIPPLHTQVLDVIESERCQVHNQEDPIERFEKLIVSQNNLTTELIAQTANTNGDSSSDPTAASIESVLSTLHDIGEIVWYKNIKPQDLVILDPRVVLDVVKEIINHEYEFLDDDEFTQLREGGAMKHALIMKFPHWRALASSEGADLVLYFKKLLEHFLLAYPAGAEVMNHTSDLMVPSLWICVPAPTEPSTPRVANDQTVVRWQYSLSSELSRPIFDQFLVLSHTPLHPRTVSCTSVLIQVQDQFAVLVNRGTGHSAAMDDITIEVVATSVEKCWCELPYFVIAMETVLDLYPGVSVDRYTYSDLGERISIQHVEKELKAACKVVGGVAKLRQSNPMMPSSLKWYTDKVWRKDPMPHES